LYTFVWVFSGGGGGGGRGGIARLKANHIHHHRLFNDCGKTHKKTGLLWTISTMYFVFYVSLGC
jgi:hypothetical protein